jgi:hypothetical protein
LGSSIPPVLRLYSDNGLFLISFQPVFFHKSSTASPTCRVCLVQHINHIGRT